MDVSSFFNFDVDWISAFDKISEAWSVVDFIIGQGFLYPILFIGATTWLAVLNFRIAIWAYHQIPIIG